MFEDLDTPFAKRSSAITFLGELLVRVNIPGVPLSERIGTVAKHEPFGVAFQPIGRERGFHADEEIPLEAIYANGDLQKPVSGADLTSLKGLLKTVFEASDRKNGIVIQSLHLSLDDAGNFPPSVWILAAIAGKTFVIDEVQLPEADEDHAQRIVDVAWTICRNALDLYDRA